MSSSFSYCIRSLQPTGERSTLVECNLPYCAKVVKMMCLRLVYFMIQLSDCTMETCMLLAGVKVREHW